MRTYRVRRRIRIRCPCREKVTMLAFIQRDLSKVHSEVFHLADRYAESLSERMMYV